MWYLLKLVNYANTQIILKNPPDHVKSRLFYTTGQCRHCLAKVGLCLGYFKQCVNRDITFTMT